ncbi:AAA family ATPase [Microbacterium rhizomatis]|uniref:AAA family ATPase n=1 Tax=Microbacterium rhizomatis TaxID=1631477 RepID=A0A5J5IWR9_9MICO|nr:AAA family ATPase [Microbacterium rhizomatis]KAA9105516.1 AAA family ATPase [Microbacterium rhizomatis]
MRGGLERWKRGVESHGVRQAIAYAHEGTCDAHLQHATGAEALEAYSAASNSAVSRFIVENGVVTSDELSAGGLRVWLTGHDPITGEERGHQRLSPDADLLLDGTLNHPKSYSIAALLHPEIAAEFEALQDRLRERILLTWQTALNARRGHGGLIREDITRIEVVELQHRRSRALDPHIHRHLWLNIKVLGADGRWSNVDSRVAMKLQTVVNAEGDLAARTDPAWIAALARHGYTLDDVGEISQLAGAVRPLSRRSAQIETNRARLIAEWSAANGGSAPSVEVHRQIDRRAWAVSRPNKPTDLDEMTWEATVRDEIATIDPILVAKRAPIDIAATALEALDFDQLAAMAIVDADERSTSSGGRFSRFDLRAGATRALSRTGVVAERDQLDGVIAEISTRAARSVVGLVAGPAPSHVKAFMATETARAKTRLAGRLDALAAPGRSMLIEELRGAAPTEDFSILDTSQTVAACAIAGTDGLVTVTGPAGSGKTTMLRVAFRALSAQRRRMLVVAPTRKAASVAAEEIGTASSIHALLTDHGYRWSTDDVGAQVWTRLSRGEADPIAGGRYSGPARWVLRARDRIVVDEAGMVDLQTANALTELALELRVGLAFVGDPRQALPVGHAGAMGFAIRHANASVELDTVHRFRDPEYAALTLRLRETGDRNHALEVASELAERGHVERVDHHEAARERMIEAYFDWHGRGKRVTLVSATNAEADAINDAIQQRRVDQGDLDAHIMAWGMGEQRILIGDTVQTRRNDRLTGVENRAQWVVRGIHDEFISLVSASDSGELRHVPHEYAREHLQLAYASTVHGVQGETAYASVVGPDVDAAGLYVGLTRGRAHNVAIVVARTDAAACECLADSMQRGTTELTIRDAMHAAQTEMRRAARNRDAVADAWLVTGAAAAGRGIAI